MKLARVTGTVTATAKEAQLVGLTLLLVEYVDGAGKVTDPACVVADTCGAGVGDTVLVTHGSAARLPAQLSGAPVDAAITAIIDRVTLANS